MSVILDGSVSEIEDHCLCWTGTWQFVKEKKTGLQFNYKRVSSEIQKNLLDYVSFVNEVSVIPTNKKNKYVKVSKSSRGRGRPPSSSTVGIDVVQVVQMNCIEYDGANDIAESNSGGNENIIHSASVMLEDQAAKGEDKSQNVQIERVHPLLGMWEGSFDVKSPEGTGKDDSVAEEFFFHSIMGGEITVELADLPPEPQFPYCLATRNESPRQANTVTIPTGEGTEGLVGVEQTVLTDKPVGQNSPESSKGEAAIDDAESGLVKDEERELQQGAVATVGLSAQKDPDCVVLVGFGRNMFGRFSVAALYNEKLGEMTCEKKYLVSKFAAKRGRKSFAETAALASSLGESAVANEGGTQTTRPKTLPIAQEGGEALLKRKRTPVIPPSLSAPKTKNDSSSLRGHPHGDVAPQPTWSMDKTTLKDGSGNSVPLALCARSPDLDGPFCDHREAFQDCDTGEIYEGGWAHGSRNGKGVCLFNDGLLYEGNWFQNKEQGKGQLMTADRRLIYSGDWLDGHFHGYGTYYFGNGDRYVGDWRESSRQGKGDYLFANGCRYSGDWRDGKRSGRGVFVWPDESFYDGDWEMDRKHGRGVLELASGFRYDGSWANNVMEGKGTCTFPSGQVYQGMFKNGVREGRGSVQFAEGAVYEGRFRDDRFDGQGTIKITDNVPGAEQDELMVPVQIQSELWRIHLKAGFGNDTH